jgi:hypothetical protein
MAVVGHALDHCRAGPGTGDSDLNPFLDFDVDITTLEGGNKFMGHALF